MKITTEMSLDVFVGADQLEDFGKTLRIGDRLDVELCGTRGSTIGPEIPPLPTYQLTNGSKYFRRVGLTEYIYSGLIAELEELQEFGYAGLIYREILIDCGVPIILVDHGSPGMAPYDVEDPSEKKLVRGRYLSGILSLFGCISYRYPALINNSLSASILAIDTIVFRSSAEFTGNRLAVESLEGALLRNPAILRLSLGPDSEAATQTLGGT